jgi:hypothetical protein
MTPMYEHALSAAEWARFAVCFGLWLAAPIGLGSWRVARTGV